MGPPGESKLVWQMDEFHCVEVYYYIIDSGINIEIILEVKWYFILSQPLHSGMLCSSRLV
jgi:hypothetical protein